MTVLSPSCCNVNEFESHWNIILQADVTETLSVDVSQPTKAHRTILPQGFLPGSILSV